MVIYNLDVDHTKYWKIIVWESTGSRQLTKLWLTAYQFIRNIESYHAILGTEIYKLINNTWRDNLSRFEWDYQATWSLKH